jgi:hypothetical protein
MADYFEVWEKTAELTSARCQECGLAYSVTTLHNENAVFFRGKKTAHQALDDRQSESCCGSRCATIFAKTAN